MAENVTVAVRVRPPNEKEQQTGDECIWAIDPVQQNTISVSPAALCDFYICSADNTPPIEVCMGHDTTNFAVFETLVRPVVDGFLGGVSGTVIVYGPTGAGKTYTMLGNEQTRENLRKASSPEDGGTDLLDPLTNEPGNPGKNGAAGVLLHALQYAFDQLAGGNRDKDVTLLRCTYVEIYNDSIYDLLQEKGSIDTPLTINELDSKKFVIKGAVEHSVRNIKELLRVIMKGERNRHYAECVMNHNSSRSHTIFQVKLRKIATEATTKSEINFVDLAGSEKCSSFSTMGEDGLKGWQMDEMQGRAKERIKEGQYINKSLFFLTQVIARKAEDKRNTSLTKMLKSSLGGNTKTSIILCISPARSQFDHSLQTLKFGLNASKIENKVKKNVCKTTSEETLKLLIAEYHSRLAALDSPQPSSANAAPPAQVSELKAENEMLWQQFVAAQQPPDLTPTKSSVAPDFSPVNDCSKKVLLQFYVDRQSPTKSIGGSEEDDEVKCTGDSESDNKLSQAFVAAVKVACRSAGYWKTMAERQRRYSLQLRDKIDQILGRSEQLKASVAARNVYICTLVEIAEDCLKSLKGQAAKLAVYEATEKWAQHLGPKELSALAAHFKSKLDCINAALHSGPRLASKRPSSKQGTMPPSPPKLDLHMRFEESYAASLFRQGKDLSATSGGEEIVVEIESPPEDEKSPMPGELDEVLSKQLAGIKETLAKLANKPKPNLASPRRRVTQECPLTPITTRNERDTSQSPLAKQLPATVCKTPNGKKASFIDFVPRRKPQEESKRRASPMQSRIPRLVPSPHSQQQPPQQKAKQSESRSTSSSSRNKKPQLADPMSVMISKVIQQVATTPHKRAEKTPTRTSLVPTLNPPKKERDADRSSESSGSEYEMGIFSNAQSMQHLASKNPQPHKERGREGGLGLGFEKSGCRSRSTLIVAQSQPTGEEDNTLRTWQKLMSALDEAK